MLGKLYKGLGGDLYRLKVTSLGDLKSTHSRARESCSYRGRRVSKQLHVVGAGARARFDTTIKPRATAGLLTAGAR